MAIGIQNQTNITAPDSDYPNGSIKDNPGDNTGTPFNKKVYDDIHQFFAKLMRRASITPNNLPDNEYIGFQYIKALNTNECKSYKAVVSQSATSAPSGNIVGDNYIGNIVWTRSGVGTYVGTLANAFPIGTWCKAPECNGGSSAILVRLNNNSVGLNTFVTPGVPADSIMNGSLEIRVYNAISGSF